MKKSIKNVIMIGMAAVLIGTSAVTFAYAKTNTNVRQLPSFSQQGGTFQGMPDMQNGSNQNGSDNQQSLPEMPSGDNQNGSGSQQTPPDLPNGDNQNGSGSQQTPPEMPSGDNQNSSGSQQTPPEMPSDDNQNGSGSQQTPPDLPSGDGQNDSNASDSQSDSTETPNSQGTSLSTEDGSTESKMMPQFQNGGGMTKNNVVIASLCYAFLALQLGIVLLIIVYLIMSRFNKLSFNEVFKK